MKKVQIESEGLSLPANREEIPRINSALVAAGINVSAIQTATQSLEEKFLQVTSRENAG
ncbi:hypothetical protein ACFO25_01475 [Paenactinomyces guangxiensis]|uniref:Uncharacterized protein n=1 Tax=Paenactinomyces guangxiensis TaxID=1490290 RepID=A0A7W1WTU4_9BACL|nr:hypothetical protein [Paenactinomyces guangxiensis]MBA4495951.1 hypothetical protein [Paenactinomyces guangxiensis]MBH8593062.1 hypothetical protein [Paenactinomyces guangxiensis]